MCARAQFPTDTLKNTQTHITTTIPQYVKVVGHINGHEKDFLPLPSPAPHPPSLKFDEGCSANFIVALMMLARFLPKAGGWRA